MVQNSFKDPHPLGFEWVQPFAFEVVNVKLLVETQSNCRREFQGNCTMLCI